VTIGSPRRSPVGEICLIKYKDAARCLGASESTARRLGASGHLDERRISAGVVRVTQESVDRLVECGYGNARTSAA